MSRLLAVLLAACTWIPFDAVFSAQPVAESVNRFSIRILNQLSERGDQNLVVSPFSVYAALCMLSVGAAGETEVELVQLLEMAEERADRLATWQDLRERIVALGRSGVTLESANRFWIQRSYDLLPEFMREMEQGLGALPGWVDFVANAEGARQEINSWVEEQTRRRIRALIAPGILDNWTRLVLVNAMYFYGLWARPFPSERTERAAFYELGTERKSEVQMMANEFGPNEVGYAEGPGWQMCEIPYQGNELAMTIMLPSAGISSWTSFRERLSREGLRGMRRHLRPRRVQVFLPRFRIESNARLDTTLQALGLRTAFDPSRADLSRITGRRELFVSAVLHKAFVEVVEKGTEAAAATAVVVALASAPVESEPPVVFRADRPFVFAIVDRTTGLSLFWGTVVRPPAPPSVP